MSQTKKGKNCGSCAHYLSEVAKDSYGCPLGLCSSKNQHYQHLYKYADQKCVLYTKKKERP